MESIVLEFEHVTGKSGKFRLSDISFALPAGYMMGLVGKDAAGKTTLCRVNSDSAQSIRFLPHQNLSFSQNLWGKSWHKITIFTFPLKKKCRLFA